MKKKLVACMLVASMAVSLAACNGGGSDDPGKKDEDTSGAKIGEYDEVEIDGIKYHKAKDLTSKTIEISYYTYDDEALVNALADRFHEIYDNITVKIVMGGSDFQATLTSLAQSGEMPDVLQYTDADYTLQSQLLGDMSEYYDNDPETQKMASTINDGRIGCFSTDARFAVPIRFFPGIVYIDRKCLEKLNIEAPGQDWTWDQMIQLIKDATQKDSTMDYYGLGWYNRLDSLYGIAASQDTYGEFGFNGDTFDLSAWAVGEQQFANLKLDGYVAPDRNSPENAAWFKSDDWDLWNGTSGHVAVFSEAFWTFQNIWNTEEYINNYDFDIVPYVIPAVSEADATAEHHSIANIDFGGISSVTENPREAYEVLKFMSFGRDGWLTRCQLYKSGAMSADGAVPLKASMMPAPITTDEEVWDAYIDMYCDGMDEEHTNLWKEYFASCMQPVPFGWTAIVGYWNFCDGYFNKIDIHKKVDKGEEKAIDFVDEATVQANSYHARAMVDNFGPDGYDILSDEDLARYQERIVQSTTE